MDTVEEVFISGRDFSATEVHDDTEYCPPRPQTSIAPASSTILTHPAAVERKKQRSRTPYLHVRSYLSSAQMIQYMEEQKWRKNEQEQQKEQRKAEREEKKRQKEIAI